MTREPATGHPVTVEFRSPRPLPVTDLATLTALTQEIADRIGAGPLYFGEHFRQVDDGFVVTFAGCIPPADDDQEQDDDMPGDPEPAPVEQGQGVVVIVGHQHPRGWHQHSRGWSDWDNDHGDPSPMPCADYSKPAEQRPGGQ
jgi:hypothetical protein